MRVFIGIDDMLVLWGDQGLFSPFSAADTNYVTFRSGGKRGARLPGATQKAAAHWIRGGVLG